MKTVRQILRAKGQQIWSIHPDATVYEALTVMADKNVGALLVLENTALVGILSERDYARKMILKGKHSKDTLVREIMSENAVCVDPERTIEDCMTLMTDKRIRHLPVMERGRLAGIMMRAGNNT